MWGYRIYYEDLIINSPIYVNNQDYVMGIFFKEWDEINSTYDPLWKKENPPRWYKRVNEGAFQIQPIAFQELEAKEYVRQHVKESMGIDHTKVEAWLLGVIRSVNAGVYTYQEVFGTGSEENNLWTSMHIHHLRQIVSLLPVREHLDILQNKMNWIFLPIPILMGIPLLIIQLSLIHI